MLRSCLADCCRRTWALAGCDGFYRTHAPVASTCCIACNYNDFSNFGGCSPWTPLAVSKRTRARVELWSVPPQKGETNGGFPANPDSIIQNRATRRNMGWPDPGLETALNELAQFRR